MNQTILNTAIQDYINKNIDSDVTQLLLKKNVFENISQKEIIEQLEAKKRSQKKLPTWYNSSNIYYPNKLNIEQTSSEITARYKSSLVSGGSLIDLTGGFGVDAYYFSKQIENVIHCEIDNKLSEIVKHNYNALNIKNITCLNENGIDALKRIDTTFDWIYLDPSRRDNSRKKVFLLSDCSPNIKTFQGLFLKYSDNVLIKTSPLLDIKATKNDIKFVKGLHIVAVDNEVKELLWLIENNYEGYLNVKTVNITNSGNQIFKFEFENEPNIESNLSGPLNYLYEPNSAILKAGAFNSVGIQLGVAKLHKHSHLYTSSNLIAFPGRIFKIDKVIPFNKKQFAKEKISKANITTRNFPLSVGDIRKKFKIKDGGNSYLFFTTDTNNSKIIIKCSKV